MRYDTASYSKREECDVVDEDSLFDRIRVHAQNGGCGGRSTPPICKAFEANLQLLMRMLCSTEEVGGVPSPAHLLTIEECRSC